MSFGTTRQHGCNLLTKNNLRLTPGGRDDVSLTYQNRRMTSSANASLPCKGDSMNFTSRPSTAGTTARTTLLCALTLALGLFSGCDYDRTGRGLNGTQQDETRIQGTVQAAPVFGSTVIAYQITADGKRGPTLGQTSTTQDGFYRLIFKSDEDSQNYSGPVLVEVLTGTFTDEATPTTVALTARMRASSSRGLKGLGR